MTAASALRVFLMGLRGSGKTRLGTALAARQSVPFVDTDAEFHARTGRTPADVLRAEGEAEFRRLESEVLLAVLDALPREWVLALGGGSLLAPGVFARLERGRRDETWIGVWLRAPAAVLARRIEADGGDATRPRLHEGNLRAEIERLARAREPRFARLTDLVVATHGAALESSTTDDREDAADGSGGPSAVVDCGLEALVLELEAKLTEKSRN